ncbi:uncharacterized protein LOC134722242 [Mytilus trossulus]|uniref:uncharacterized protein LOC134722242 n=1 Tax=Mytilus trossulus TaxID=6551 RepID=UPI003005D957
MNLSNKSGWIQLDECRGYASNIQQAEEVRQTFEVSKRSTFVSYKTVLNFGKNDKIPEKYRIRFSDLGEEVVPYDGTPFIITGRKVNSCIFGKDKHVADKKKKQQDKASNLECGVQDHLLSENNVSTIGRSLEFIGRSTRSPVIWTLKVCYRLIY